MTLQRISMLNYNTKFMKPPFSGANIATTPEVRASAIFLLLAAGT
jgi:hypothetical protein